MSDEKTQKFEELAARRVENAIHSIGIIGTLGKNKSKYHYTQEHVDQIFGAIDAAVADMKENFAPKKEETKPSGFSFAGIKTVSPGADVPADSSGCPTDAAEDC